MFCENNMSQLMKHQKVFMHKEARKLGFVNPTQLFLKDPELFKSLSMMFDLLFRKSYLL